ncbi:hypothetical protein TNCV_832541 [Trichonephila clavipes]|nr:hypothetical protein TNCV_832541 [Trichonephila clavipes]
MLVHPLVICNMQGKHRPKQGGDETWSLQRKHLVHLDGRVKFRQDNTDTQIRSCSVPDPQNRDPVRKAERISNSDRCQTMSRIFSFESADTNLTFIRLFQHDSFKIIGLNGFQ